MTSGQSRLPSKKECQTAIKILTQYERLARKFQKNIPEDRLAELNRLRDAGNITINDIPATLGHEFPGVFGNMTLEEIRQLCSQI
ncbi:MULTISPECIES: hypothetical protein [Cyanophyceae]|uniref:hypothetical protein n=1 Tax=Cyanophyceae TaxID=3028117 RepID=UPI0016878209|nr:hypothetical protein [Trichocoleus sp. FACHB-69]MBD1932667.1 hypothetical protein [Trichocoleus sp. FACHB-69]